MAKAPNKATTTPPEPKPKQNRADKADAAVRALISSVDASIRENCGHSLIEEADKIRESARTGNMANLVICGLADAQKVLGE